MTRTRTLLWLLAASVTASGCSYMPSWLGGKEEQKPKLPGERIAILPVETNLKPDDTVKETAFAMMPPERNTDWSQHSGNVSSAVANLEIHGKLDSMTHATIGEGEEFDHTLVPPPVVGGPDGNTVFAMDAVGTISAHDTANIGTIRWKSKGVSEEDEPEIMGGGLAYDQGKLYAVSGRGIAAAFDARTGKELWHKVLHVPFRSPPRIEGDKLFAVTIDNQLFALKTANGDIAWNHRGIDETGQMMTAVSPALTGDTVIAPYSSGEIYALSTADGKELWSDSLSTGKSIKEGTVFAGISGDPIVDGDVIFTVSSGDMLTVFYAPNGRRLWEKPVGALNPPWLAGDYLFLLAKDNTLVCMVKYDGRVRWATKLPSFEDEKAKKRPVVWHGPVLIDDMLAVVGSNGQLTLISDKDGKALPAKAIPEGIFTPPVVAGGRIYLIGKDATLYSLQ